MPGQVRVCILSYNRPELLEKAIASVLSQTRTPQEIRILDNASTRDTYSVVLRHPRLVWDPSPWNLGLRGNVQRAYNWTDTEYLYVMHDDDVLHENYLERCVSFLEENPGCVCVTTSARTIGMDDAPIGTLLSVPEVRSFSCPGDLVAHYLNGFLAFPTALYRTKALPSVSILNEISMRLDKMADFEVFVQLSRLGTVMQLPDILVDVRLHSAQGSAAFSETEMAAMEEYWQELAGQSGSRGLVAQVASEVRRRRTERLWNHLRDRLRHGPRNQSLQWSMRDICWRYLAARCFGRLGRVIGRTFSKWQ